MEFGEISNVISGSSISMRYTKQLNLNGYIGAKIKGRVLQIMGNLPFELAKLAIDRGSNISTPCESQPFLTQTFNKFIKKLLFAKLIKDADAENSCERFKLKKNSSA